MLKYLIKKGYVNVNKILIENYSKLGISELELVVIMKLFEQLKSNQHTLSVSSLAKKMSFTTEECSNVVNGLFNRGLVTLGVEYNKSGKAKETFNLDDFIKCLEKYFIEELQSITLANNETMITKVVDLCETSFNRNLKPSELELVVHWVEIDVPFENIRKSLDVAVLKKASNLKYVDQVLVSLNEKPKSPDLAEEDSKMLDDFFRNIK